MEMILLVAGTILVLLVAAAISGFCGWEFLKDKPWFWRLHKDSKIRRNIIIALLCTIGIPFVWGFLCLGCIMLFSVSCYELIKYGQTTGYD